MSSGAQQRRKHAKDDPHVTKDHALSPDKKETSPSDQSATKKKRHFKGCRRISVAVVVVLLAIIWGLWNEVGATFCDQVSLDVQAFPCS